MTKIKIPLAKIEGAAKKGDAAAKEGAEQASKPEAAVTEAQPQVAGAGGTQPQVAEAKVAQAPEEQAQAKAAQAPKAQSQTQPQAAEAQPKAPKAQVAQQQPAAQQPKASKPQAKAARPKAKVLVDERASIEDDEAFDDQAFAGERFDPSQDVPHGSFGWVSKVFPGCEYAVLGGLAGLVGALLIFLVGFWQVFFVAILVFVGVAVGQYLDGDPKIVNALRRLFSEGRGN